MNDLQSFTPLRFMPPRLMGFAGRALVIDPDIFAIGDVFELLSRDMMGKAVLGRRRFAEKRCVATSVMLLDCAGLREWDAEREFAELFEFKRDYKDWICLHHMPDAKTGYLEPEWNDFDRLTPATKMLHNTRRRTQPWKTGLPVDFVPADKLKRVPAAPHAGPVAGAHLRRVRLPRTLCASPGPQPGGALLLLFGMSRPWERDGRAGEAGEAPITAARALELGATPRAPSAAAAQPETSSRDGGHRRDAVRARSHSRA